MIVTQTRLPGVLIIEPRVIGDARGFFFESYNRRRFEEAVGEAADFVQDNHSRSCRDVLRGLHYQLPPNAQGKLVRVASGAIFDVAVDLRRSSATFGRWTGIELSADNHRQFWVPPGFAHGFLTLSETADVLYKASGFYSPEDEGALAWNDPEVGIEWPLAGDAILSDKDRTAPSLAVARTFD
jgi:dTDP-4-dehydrorhamnose 3,5-epimerase